MNNENDSEKTKFYNPFVEILYIGNYHFNNVYHIHSHKYYQMFYCLNGGGEVFLDNEMHDLKPDHCYFCAPSINHAIRCNKASDPPVLIDIKFTAEDDELDNDLKNLPPVFSLMNVHFSRSILKRIVTESAEKQPYYHCRANSYFALYITKCVRELLKPIATPESVMPAEERDLNELVDVRFEKVLDFIDRNIHNKLTLTELCKIVNFNTSHLIKLFKDVYGTTPLKYISSIRIEKAKDLLINTNASITDIAMQTGFQTIHYFSHAFKQHTGMSPIDFRIKNRENKHIELI